MSRSATLVLDWADDAYTFRLAWGQLEELQEACNAGPQRILVRLASDDWRTRDVRETIRLGLIGGGLEPAKALKLVRAYVEDRPPAENVVIALAILQAAIIGAPEENVSPSAKGERIDDLPNEKLNVGKVLGAGAAMGFSPEQVKAMSLYEFAAAARGVAEANAPAAGGMSSAEADEVWRWMQEREAATLN